MDPPGGVEVKDDLYFNPYFPGQSIAMAPALYNEIIEYEDGKEKVFFTKPQHNFAMSNFDIFEKHK